MSLEEIQTLRFLKGKTVRDFFGAVFLPIYLVWRMRTRIFYFRGQLARQPCLQMIFGFYCFSNRYDVGVKRYFAPYDTRIASHFMLSQS